MRNALTLLIIIFSANLYGAEVINIDQLFLKMKTAYNAKEYSKVFSYAQFYRHKYLKNAEFQKQFYVKEFLLVEAISLSQLCQFTLVDRLLSEIKVITANVGKSEDFKDIETKIFLSKEYAVLKNPGQKTESFTLKETIFPVKQEQVIFDPEKFRVIVEDLCQK